MTTEVVPTHEEPIPNVKYLISDFDGTLVDSMDAYTQCFVKTMSGIIDDPEKLSEYYMSSAGKALTNQIREAASSLAGLQIEDTKELESKFFEYYKEFPEIEVIEGAKEALSKLKESGIKITVWSGTRTDVLGEKLTQAGLMPFVDYFIGNVPGDDKLVKGPGLFSQIADHFGVSTEDLRENSLVIGDGIGDIEAGKKSGARTVALGPNRDSLKEADFVIKSIASLPARLR